jgi:hypothetical protein
LKDNSYWHLYLLLRDIVALICAPTATENMSAYLKILTEGYLTQRKVLFPDVPLRPKHHYLLHYPELMIQFGPLIRVWTLRFEAKHSYFKECARKLHNFKNLPLTLSERHQLLQAYLHEGNLFQQQLQVEKGINFVARRYQREIQNAVSSYQFKSDEVVASDCITIKGTLYKEGLFVCLEEGDDGIVFGRIEVILVKRSCEAYFVTSVYQSLLHVDSGLYGLVDYDPTGANVDFRCTSADSLLDYYPLPCYMFDGIHAIALHHEVTLH